MALDSHDSCQKIPFSEIHRQNDNKLRRPNRIYNSFKKWTHWMRVQVYFTIEGSSSIFFKSFFLKTIFFSCFFLRFQVEWMQKLKKINAVTVYISFRLRQTSQQGVPIIYTDWWKKNGVEPLHVNWNSVMTFSNIWRCCQKSFKFFCREFHKIQQYLCEMNACKRMMNKCEMNACKSRLSI